MTAEERNMEHRINFYNKLKKIERYGDEDLCEFFIKCDKLYNLINFWYCVGDINFDDYCEFKHEIDKLLDNTIDDEMT